MSVCERSLITIDIISLLRTPCLKRAELRDQIAFVLSGQVGRLGNLRQAVETVADGAYFCLGRPALRRPLPRGRNEESARRTAQATHCSLAPQQRAKSGHSYLCGQRSRSKYSGLRLSPGPPSNSPASPITCRRTRCGRPRRQGRRRRAASRPRTAATSTGRPR